MTVASENKRTQYTGTGSTGPFSIGFAVLADTHIKVTRTVIATGADTELTLNAGTDGFTVNTDLSEVTLTEALANSTERLTIERDVPLTQLVDYVANSAFPAEVNETALDQLTMIAQQLEDAVDRSVKVPSSSSITSVNLSDYSADKVIAWDPSTAGDIVNSTKTLTDIEGAVDAVAALTATSGVKVSDNDTTVGFLNGKLVAGDGLTFTENNDGGSETLTIDAEVSLAGDQTFTGNNIFQGIVDVTNINAETSAGGALRTNGGTSCISWGGGGAANSTLGGNMSGASTHKLVNMADPTADQDYATKAYVDTNGVTLEYSTIPAATGTGGNIPEDNTTPLVSEGTEIATDSITPANDTLRVRVQASFSATNDGGRNMIAVLFRGSTAIAACYAGDSASNKPNVMSFNVVDSPATDSAVTYSIRFGKTTGVETWYVNQVSGATLGGIPVNNGMTLETVV